MAVRLLENDRTLRSDLGVVVDLNYLEEKRFWRQKYDAGLRVAVRCGDPENLESRVFYEEFDITNFKLEKTVEIGNDHELNIFKYLDHIVRTVRLMTKDMISDDNFLTVEQEIVRNVAIVTERPRIAEDYCSVKGDLRKLLGEEERVKKDAAKKKEEERKERELNARRSKIAGKVKEHVLEIETGAMYQLSVNASRKLDYNITRDRVERRVKALFHNDENLSFRPVAKQFESGTWKSFISETLGEGFYNKLKNIEHDLDNFYIAILEKVQSLVNCESEVTKEVYEQTICETFTLEQVMDLFERERDVYMDLLTRFKDISERECGDYNETLKGVEKGLGFYEDFLIPINGSVLEFKLDFNINDTRVAYEGAILRVKKELEEYLKSNSQSLRVFSDDQDYFKKGDEILKIRDDSDTKASNRSYGVIEKMNSNGDPDVNFSYVPGRMQQELFKINYTSVANLRRLLNLEKAFGSLAIAVDYIVDEVSKKSVSSTQTTRFKKQAKKVRKYHPYLNEQLEFRQKFYELMTERFKGMYARQGVQVPESADVREDLSVFKDEPVVNGVPH